MTYSPLVYWVYILYPQANNSSPFNTISDSANALRLKLNPLLREYGNSTMSKISLLISELRFIFNLNISVIFINCNRAC